MTKKDLQALTLKTFAGCSRQDMRFGYGAVPGQKLLDLIEALEARVAKLERIGDLQATIIRHDLPKKQFREKEEELVKELNDES